MSESPDPFRYAAAELEDTGFAVLTDRLDPAELDHYRSAVNAALPPLAGPIDNRADALAGVPALRNLVDRPAVLGAVVAVMGPNIRINFSAVARLGNSSPEHPQDWGWHRDGGAVHRDLQGRAPLLGLRCGIYLSDQTADDSGQTWVIPGSHRPATETAKPDIGFAVPVRVPPGSIVLYHSNLWHSLRSPNRHGQRTAVFLNYAFRWLQPLDAAGHRAAPGDSPVRRQLLGAIDAAGRGDDASIHDYATGRSAAYYPSAAQLPLREWQARTTPQR